jgi:uncharacterized protein (TIGR02246 family)
MVLMYAFICTLFLVFSAAANAQETPPPDAVEATEEVAVAAVPAAPVPTDEELHDELRAVKTAMEAALNAGDMKTILSYAHEDVVFTTMNGDVVRGRDDVSAYYEKMMGGTTPVVKTVESSFIPDGLSSLHGKDMAVAYGHTDDHYVLADGSEFDVSALWSSTMIRRDNAWKIVSFHYSTNMFDNPVLATQRSFLLMAMAGGVGVAGIAGFLLGLALFRRPQG